MKLSTKSSIRNIIVTLVLLGTASFFGWKFWEELTSSADNISGEAIGKIVEVRGEAQRRYAKSAKWKSMHPDESVYNLDAIKTNENSSAVIVLQNTDDNGNKTYDEISLGPDTYIILNLTGKNRNIKFIGGDISASISKNLTVTTSDNTTVELDKGSVSLNRKEGKETVVSVSDGKATVISGKEKTVLDNETTLNINESSNITRIQKNPVNLLTPKPNALLITYNEKRNVNFKWKLLKDYSEPDIEVSGDPSFSGDKIKQKVSGESISLKLTPGTWYWRITDSAAGENESIPVNIFSIEKDTPVELSAPSDNQLIYYSSEKPSVLFQWKNAWLADSYKLDISRNSSLSDPAVSRTVSGSTVLIDSLSEGKWYWRITPDYFRGIPETDKPSEISSFTLEAKEGFSPVILLSPADNQEMSALDIRDGILFRWEYQEGIKQYHIVVAKDKNFTDKTADSFTENNWITLMPAPAEGTYFWKISAEPENGSEVPDSDTYSFTVKPITGSVELIDPASGSTKEIKPYSSHTFVWHSSLQGTAKVTIQRLTDRENQIWTNIIESLVKSETLTAPLAGEGTYKWQVQILDDKGRLIIESPEEVFYIRSTFNYPLLTSPVPDSVIELIGTNTITTGWNPAPDADYYRVVLKDPNGKIAAQKSDVRSLVTDLTVPYGSPPGLWTIELTSFRNNPPPGAQAQSETGIYHFRIGKIVEYKPAVPVSPANGTRFSAVEALNNGIKLQWKQDPLLPHFTIELNNGRATRLYQTNRTEIILDGLNAGTYRWKVKSSDDIGRNAPDSREYSFSISGLPVLKKPEIIFPADGQNVDMSGKHSLTFTWEAVENAQFYNIALYFADSPVPVLRENGIRGTQYTLNDLRMLDIGKFTLTVQAGYEYEESGITGKSLKAKSEFNISLDISPEKPEILTDEIQYAE